MMKKCLFLMLMLVSGTLFFSQQRAQWLAAGNPNYTDNLNLAYACSNEEYSEGTVNVIPVPSSFIDLIDFYGEGRTVHEAVTTGFKNAYNINHQYRLVNSDGPDKNRKIPNRIPVRDYNHLNLSKYVADDKVSAITLMGVGIQQNTAEEMSRMIRKDGLGKIIIYGFNATDPDVQRLENELQKIGFYYSPKYLLEAPFNEIRGFVDAPRVYTSKKMKVTGEKVFYSVNAKTDTGTSEDDMVQLNYSSLLALGADLSGGIKGTIDQPGGRITVEVYPYDGNEADGFQKLVSLDQILNRKKIVYSAYSDESNVNQYIEKTINVPYGFDANNDRRFQILKNTTSNNIKLLGGTSQNSWWSSNACKWLPVRAFSWMAWNIKSLFWEVPDACNEVVTKFRTGKQPVILKITIKDATLYDYKIPGIASNMAFNLKGLEEYKMIKKLKVTILESPNDSKSVAFYKGIVEEQLKETNRYYSAKTGNVKHPLINAEVGNPRILFKNVDLIIKKASRKNYNYQIPAENNLLESDAGVNNNDDETMQLLYIHSLSTFYPPRTTNTRVIRGYSTSLDSPIQNSDYTVCSYSRWGDNIQEYGSFGLTVAHEFGHYFNLYHTFEGGCSQSGGGDQVADTPPAENGTWYMIDVGTPNERGIDNPCQNFPSCSGTRRQVENIMDYGPCRWLFTKGQADRITDRINTKPSLFSTLNVYDTDPRVNPDVIHFSITDLRHFDMRRKTGPEVPGLSVRMIYPSSKNGDYIVKVVSDKAEKGKIVIFNDNRIKVYEKDVQVEKGSNDFVIESNLFDRIGLYTLLYTSTSASQQVRILPLHL